MLNSHYIHTIPDNTNIIAKFVCRQLGLLFLFSIIPLCSEVTVFLKSLGDEFWDRMGSVTIPR